MADQSIACPSCGKKIPLTRALRAEIETSLKAEFGERERELRDEYERKLDADRERVEKDAAKTGGEEARPGACRTAGAAEGPGQGAGRRPACGVGAAEARAGAGAQAGGSRGHDRQDAGRRAREAGHRNPGARRRAASPERCRERTSARRDAAADRRPEAEGGPGVAAAPGRSGRGRDRNQPARRVPDGRNQRHRTGRPRRRHPPRRRRLRAARSAAPSSGSARTRGTGATAGSRS